tara:strand:- start:113800 stop:114504 length:705 start_codon:yes stop_codon:yes gene_type:complete
MILMVMIKTKQTLLIAFIGLAAFFAQASFAFAETVVVAEKASSGSDLVPAMSSKEKTEVAIIPASEAEDVVVVSTKNVTVANAYRIGSGDKLDITVFGEEELSKTYTVDGQGYISMPLVGNVLVSGLTPLQTERLLEEKFAEGYLVDPSIAIEISEYRPFYIIGEIRRPGSYNYIDGMNVLNAVAVGGGFTYRAKTKQVEVIRPVEGGGNIEVVLGVDDPVLPGDIIRIRERFF